MFGTDWPSHGLVCDRGDGEPIRRHSLAHAFARITERAGSPGTRFHDLRHGAATVRLAKGVPPKVVSEMLGHSSVAFTMDVYQHVLPSMGHLPADAIQAAAIGDAIG
jgi:integrase